MGIKAPGVVKDVYTLSLCMSDQWMRPPVLIRDARITEHTVISPDGRMRRIGSGVLVFDTFERAMEALLDRKAKVIESFRSQITEVEKSIGKLKALTAADCREAGALD